MATTYGIRDWTRYFAKGDAVKYKFWKFVPIPTNLNSEAFRILMRTTEGREAFAVFIALVELAANLPRRGVLADERGPLSVDTIEIKTNIPKAVIESAMGILAANGWLVEEGSAVFLASFGASSEFSEGSPKNLPPIPSPSHPTQSPSLTPTQPPARTRTAAVPIGSGGTGIKWNTESLRRWLLSCQVNPNTAAELAGYADKLDGVDLAAEWKRIKGDWRRKDKAATLVGWIDTFVGIDRGSVGSIAMAQARGVRS
jgi:hypothetical protein